MMAFFPRHEEVTIEKTIIDDETKEILNDIAYYLSVIANHINPDAPVRQREYTEEELEEQRVKSLEKFLEVCANEAGRLR